ncbi:hypothetical protein Thpro_020762 [Acidihalobacter prosperus]|uniref:Uncharacterized protein n=1 Tax=Acidihalobacter prosperus TaxID=160660 RepID=A0A1A6C904_9GAMM|nr:hypothetical protein Thpro_020762 [Acidihalobacter prosperus]
MCHDDLFSSFGLDLHAPQSATPHLDEIAGHPADRDGACVSLNDACRHRGCARRPAKQRLGAGVCATRRRFIP